MILVYWGGITITFSIEILNLSQRIGRSDKRPLDKCECLAAPDTCQEEKVLFIMQKVIFRVEPLAFILVVSVKHLQLILYD